VTWSALQPAALLTLGILGVLGVDLATRGRRPLAALGVALAALLGAAAAAGFGPRSSDVVLGVLRVDSFSVVFTVFCSVTGFVSLLAATRGEALRRPGGEFLMLVLSAVLGMSILAASVDMATLYLAFETVSIPSYVLVGMRRADRAANEASMKYVLFGAVSSGLMLYGLSLLVGLAGGTSLEALAAAVRNGAGSQPAFVVGAVLVFAGFAFKISAVPFHFWAPDVYAGAPAAVGGFLAVASKAAGFAVIFRTLSALGMSVPDATDAVGTLLPSGGVLPALVALCAIATMTVGNLAALRQREVKRLLAWSSIAHAGYILLAVSVWSERATSAMLLYLVSYLFMNLAAFLVAGISIRELGTGNLSAFRGLGRRAPVLALAFAVILFSLTGLPPFFGFVAKLSVFYAVFEKHYLWLGVIGLVNGAISLYYYAKIIGWMYLTSSDEAEGAEVRPLALGTLDGVLCALLVVPIFVFGIFWSGLWSWAESVSRTLGW
jgi:NADH-quinone oxidoreductase subunit N